MIAQIKNYTLPTDIKQFSRTKLHIKSKLMLIAASFAILQFAIRLGCMGRYGFHQDELLYMALGEHLGWGYKETPPFIALAALFSKTFIGSSVFAMRVLPSLCAALIVYLTGMITIKMGGRFFAVTIACAGVAFSSAFLATGALFIPQVFDELCWTLAAYLLVSWYQKKEDKYLIFLGVVFGLGMMVKYTIALYGLGLLIGLGAFPVTRIIFSRQAFWKMLFIALVLFAPNLIWQIVHGFPLIRHYTELRETQLVYITSFDFIVQQVFVNGSGIIIWMAGIVLVFSYKKFYKYRFIAIAYLFVITVLMLLSGKAYYAFGAFPALFAAGAIFYEKQFKAKQALARRTFFVTLLVPNLLLMIIVLPFLPIEKTARVFEWTYIHLNIHFPLKWEDQKIHNMNQNYADMIGWDELALKTAKLYNSLPLSERKNTVIYADNYGEAGAIDHYQKDFNLPQLISLRSSYSIWAPENFAAKNMIYIGNELPSYAIGKVTKYGEVTNRYSRVKGMDIYFVENVSSNFRKNYRAQWIDKR